MSSGSRGGRGSVTNNTSKSGSSKTAANTENGPTNSTGAADKAAKAAPTPEQIRLAQIIDTTQASQVDRALQDKIDQLMQITGKDSEEAHIILHDHANDLAAAVDAIYEGGANTEAWHERTKKKKPKAKGELENNKENRRGGPAGVNENNRERSGSRPRGGRGGPNNRGSGRRDVDPAGGGGGRGGPGRRGGGRGLANGGGPPGVGRGRGGTRSARGGRGGNAGAAPHIPNDTFHMDRQNLATFDEAIDTWGGEAVSIEQQPAGQDAYADPNSVGTLEDWGEEWTGSLNETNVFVPTSVEPTPPPASDLTAIDAAKLVNSSPIQQQQNSYHHQQMEEQLLMGSVSVGAASPGTHQSYSSVANSTTSPHSLGGPAGVLMSNSQHSTAAMDLAALLQQAAPQSQLSGLGTNSSLLSNASANANGSLVHLQQQTSNILGGISTNVGDVLAASGGTINSGAVLGGAGGGSSLGSGAGGSYEASGQTIASSMSHYSAAPQHTSIFASSLQNTVSRSLSNSLSSSNSSGINSNNNSGGTNKPGVIMPGMMPPVSGQTQRPKQTRPRPQPTSKIPQSAVEMPEDAMSAVNMQLTGLKFGSEGFDFMAEPNKCMQPSSALSMSNDTSYPPPSVSSYSNSVAYPPPPSVNATGSSTPSYGGGGCVSAPSASSSAVSATSYVNSSYHNSGYANSGQSSSPLNSYDRSGGNQQQNSYNSSAGSSAMSSALAAQDRSDSAQQAALSQNQNLGPEPIPYPSHSSTAGGGVSSSSSVSSSQQQNSGNPDSNSLGGANTTSYMNMRPAAAAAAAAAAAVAVGGGGGGGSTTPQKKDPMVTAGLTSSLNSSSGGGVLSGASSGSLGGLVASGASGSQSHYSAYSLPKTTTTFPSPPSVPYSQSQNSYSNNSQDVGSSNSVSGNNNNSNSYNSSGGSGGSNALSGGHSGSMSSNTGVSSSGNTGVSSSSGGGGGNSYGGATTYAQQQQSSSSASSGGGVSQQQQQYHHTSPTSAGQTAASVQYQNSYNSSSHSNLSAISSKQLTPLKEPPQVSYSNDSVGVSCSVNNSSNNNSGPVSSSSNLSSLQAAAVAAAASQQQQQQQVQQHSQHKPSPTSVPPPGVHQQQQQQQQQQQHHQQQQSSHLAQQHQAAAVAQQQMLVQQQQQQQQQHQFVNNNAAALQAGTMPFFPSLQPQIYSYEELQLLQQRMPHMTQQVPSTLAGSRDASSLNAAAYSAADVAKFRSEQNSSPVPSALNTQGGHAGAYIANAGNAAAMHPMYMYHQNVAVPSSFPQYAAPAIIQLPPNTGSSSSQFQPTPKLQYNAAAGPTYYDSQGGADYKGGYGAGSQGQSKQGVGNNAGSMTSAVSDIPAYKNHLKSYEKSGGFHTSTPPPFNLAGSAGAPYAHAQVFLPAMPQAQHHSTLMHHQLHQDSSSAGGQRGGSNGGVNKGASKPYQNQFWSNS